MNDSGNKIDRRNVAEVLGLTSMQEGMLFHYLSNPGSQQYLEQFQFGLTGAIDENRFQRAWDIVARSNEMLRAVIRWERLEEPVQIILKEKNLGIRIEDFTHESPETAQRKLKQVIEADRGQPVDITRDPIRIKLCKLNAQESVMIITFHHMIYDGWSNGILLTEFLETYQRLTAGENPAQLTREKTAYKEFYQWYKQQDREEQERFWQDCMMGFNTCTLLPADRRHLDEIGEVVTYGVKLPQTLGQDLENMVREQGLTLAAVLYAAWGILLQKYNSSDDVIFGTTVSGRPPAVKGIDSVVGLFINTLPLRLTSHGEDRVLDVCRSILDHLNQRSAFEHTALTEIKKFTGIGKDNNLFDSLVVIDNYPLENLLNGKGPIAISSYELFEMTNFDLTLQVLPGKHLDIGFHYNPGVFDSQTCERMAQHFVNILSALVNEPGQSAARLPMLSRTETKHLLEELNEPGICFTINEKIHEVIENQVERFPKNPAVQFGNEKLDYNEFNRACNRLARLLQAHGVTAGSRVAMMIPRSIEMIVGVVAILKTGAACIPLDRFYPDERNRFIIEDSGARFFLKIPAIQLQHEGQVEDIDYVGTKLAKYSGENLGVKVQPTDLSYIIYTSGSTGQPKGALLHHSGVVNHTWTKIKVLEITDVDSVANNFSVNVIASVWQILSPLFTGARLVVYTDDVEWDPYLQFQRVAADQVTVIEVIPPVLKTYLFLLDDGKEKINLQQLRRIALTSEETKPFLVNKFYSYYSHIRLVDCYGQTECCDDVLHYVIPLATDTQVVPIGTPSLNTRVFVLNHHQQLQPVGVAGEICVSGAGVGYGYWNRPDLSSEKFVDNPLEPGKPMYRTGDLGRWTKQGWVEYLGRIDHQVKIRGNRVELREIENRLIGFPSIIEAAVIAREDRQGELNLYAFLAAERSLTTGEIREYLLKQLPDYMVPVQFVQMEKLPLTPNGKIDRKTLAKIEGSIGIGTEYEPPRNDYESGIETIWRELLDKERIGVNDNFFDLGGHSLLLIKLKSRLEKAYNREIGIIELFNYPTVALQAQFIAGTFDAGEKLAERETRSEEKATGSKQDSHPDIAIIGMVLRVPGADNLDKFWTNLIQGSESITFFNPAELEQAGFDDYIKGNMKLVPARGVMGDVDMFDADFFGFNPREAEMTDPQQRIFLEYSWQALEDAGYIGETYSGSIGVYAGVGMNTYMLNNVMANREVVNTLGEFQTMIGNDKDFLTTRVAYKLGLKGPAFTVQCACSTSLVAIHLARRALLNGECDMALAGGVFVSIPEKSGYFYNEGGYLSPDGHCRAFSADAQGTVFGNGVGIVVLKPYNRALADHDYIYALIKGSAINNDGAFKVGYTSPSEIGQAAVITAALREAGVSPETIGYIETHGTGTVLGDPVEVSALTRAFKSLVPGENNKKQYCALASIKANIGHLDVAAGVVGLIKAVLCLRHKKIAPSINVSTTNPMIDFAQTPFFVNTQPLDWVPPAPGIPRRAGVSSFGIGGTNAHIILEETPLSKTIETRNNDFPRTGQLIILSARTEKALRDSAGRLATHLKENRDENLENVAYTLAVGRKAFDHRLAVVCQDREDTVSVLQNFTPKRVLLHQHSEGEKPAVFMFSGVGEHYVNMTHQLYQEEPLFREEVDRCCQLLTPILETDLRQVLYTGSIIGKENLPSLDLRKLLNRSETQLSPEAERLNRTVYLQCAIFVIEYALARLLISWGIKPYAMIGYSTGEYVAACLAGVFSLEDALYLVAHRAKLIDQVEPGAMTAVSLPEDQLLPLLPVGITIVAVNTPGLCVVSGKTQAIEILEQTLTARGDVSRRLPTFQAFHSPMMEAVREPLTELFKKIPAAQPTIPYISNVTGTWVTPAQVTDPGYWVTHTVSAIRFSPGIHRLLETNSRFFIEIGPGNSLCGFVAQHPRNEVVKGRFVLATLPKASENIPARQFLLRALGKLWIAGQDIHWSSFYQVPGNENQLQRVSLPVYPFERKRFWLETGKLHPATVAASASPVTASPAVGIIRKKENIDDWFYVPTWKQGVPLLVDHRNHQTVPPMTWLLFSLDNECCHGLCQQVKERLLQAGQDVIEVWPGDYYQSNHRNEFRVKPTEYEHYLQMLAEIQEQGKTIERMVHMWTWDDDDTYQPLGLEPIEPGVVGLFYLVKALGARFIFNMIDLWVVSRGVFTIESSDRCHPFNAALTGPVKVISQEYPNITGRLLDIAPSGRENNGNTVSNMAGLLVNEFFQALPDRSIAYRGGWRWHQSYDAVRPPQSHPGEKGVFTRLHQRGVYLITGGLGHIGLTLARFLARSVQARLVLTTRSPFPATASENNSADKRMKAIREMTALGAEVMVLQADSANVEHMTGVVRQTLECFGTLNGVIHAAGVMSPAAFKLVSDLEIEDCWSHFVPKIKGVQVLEQVLQGRKLDFCLLTSSLSPVLGGLSLYAYSAANGYMDGFARARFGDECQWLSVNWADWQKDEAVGGGIDTVIGATVTALNITAQEGEETFKRALVFAGTVSQVVISSGDLHRRLRQWVLPDATDAVAGEKELITPQVHQRPQLQSIYEPPKNEAEKIVTEFWQELLGLDMVGIHDNFFELGGHSLIATKLISRLREVFRIDIPLPTLFDRPTIREIIDYIIHSWGSVETVDEIAQTYREVQMMI